MLEDLEELKEWLEHELYIADMWEDREAVIEELGLEGWKSTLLLALELLN